MGSTIDDFFYEQHLEDSYWLEKAKREKTIL